MTHHEYQDVHCPCIVLFQYAGQCSRRERRVGLGQARHAECAGVGIVAEVSVRPGEAVAAGQSLLSLDAREVRARVAHANSAVKKLVLHRAEAEREWERAQELFDRTVLSERELQLAEIGLNDADAAYQAAQAERIAAEVALECHSIKAPFAAWVLAVPVAPGQAIVNTNKRRRW